MGPAQKNHGEAVDLYGPGQLRKTEARRQTKGAGLAESETETQSSLWIMVGVAVVGETPPLLHEFTGKWARGE